MRKLHTLILATVLAAIAGAAFAAAPAYYVQAEVIRGSKNATGPTCCLSAPSRPASRRSGWSRPTAPRPAMRSPQSKPNSST